MIIIDFKLAFGSDFNLASHGSMGFWNFKWLKSFSVFFFFLILVYTLQHWLITEFIVSSKVEKFMRVPWWPSSENYGLPLLRLRFNPWVRKLRSCKPCSVAKKIKKFKILVLTVRRISVHYLTSIFYFDDYHKPFLISPVVIHVFIFVVVHH